MIHPRGAAPFLILFVMLSGGAGTLAAQDVGGSAGIAVPVGALAENRDPGFRIQGSLFSANGRWRGDLAGVSFPGSTAESGGRHADWRAVNVGVNVLPVLVRSQGLRVRGLAGLSAYWVDVPQSTNPYGTVAGLQLGGVLERSTRRGTVTLEAGWHLVVSDYGVGELEAPMFIPVLVGIRF